MSEYFKEYYMRLSKEDRQRHLDMSTPCKERGGNSTTARGVLAQYLDTPIPMGRVAILAHACNNGDCSNPQHLYWATDKENIVEDGKEFGTWKNPWERKVEKYGIDKAREMNNNGAQSKAGQGNKGKPKSEEHKRKIAEAIRQKNLTKKQNDAKLNE